MDEPVLSGSRSRDRGCAADVRRGALMTTALRLTPVTISEAIAFVAVHHRHHAHVVGGLFAVGVSAGDEMRGVAIVGRPVARKLAASGWTAEVTRCCTDGTRNACSMLYGACWRAARALGYRRLITYTGKHEPGVSLLASGWRVVGETKRQDVESAIKAASRQAPIGAAITLGGIPMTTAKQGKCWKCGHDDHFVNQYALAVFCNVEGCECKHDLDKLMSLAGAAAVPVAIWDEVIRTCSPCHPDVLRMLGGVRDAVAALKGEGVMGKPIEPDRPAARLCGSCWDRLCDGCQDVCINDAMREAKAMDSARRECAEMLEAFVARHGTTKFVVVPMDEFRKCIAKMERGE